MQDNQTNRGGNGYGLRGLVLVLLAALSSFEAQSASRSVVIGANTRTLRELPAGTPVWSALGSYRIEGRITISSLPSVASSIFRVTNDLGILLSPDGNIFTTVRASAGGPFCALNGGTEIRFRMRRDMVAAEYTLEVWNELTGSYCSNRSPDTNPTTYNTTGVGNGFGVGAIYEPVSPQMEVGFLRIYSDPGTTGATPPRRFITNGYGDIANYEFENTLNDLSGRNMHLSVTEGAVSYRETPRFSPVMRVTAASTMRAGSRQRMEANGYANDDSAGLQTSWRQKSGPFEGLWRRESDTVVYFTPPIVGLYELTAVVQTESGLRAQQEFTVNALLTDRRNNVRLGNAEIEGLVGPLVRLGSNPWTWFDDRAIVSAQFQIDMQTGANGAPAFWSAPWEANLPGTVSVSNGSNVVTGSGTQFQTDFCGGDGNTTPTFSFSQIYIKYNSAEYPGTQGLARYNVVACNSQTQITINAGWGHATGTQTGIRFARADASISGWWTNTNTPGNYYDNVLALYTLYYRSGEVKYRDAARLLARNWWYGPFFDRGKNYDTSALGGNFISAGPARGQSITGLFLWALESGENIWPGMNYVLTWFRDVGWTYASTRNWNTQLGDLREQGYITAAYALAARYHPDAGLRQTYRGYLKDYINRLWKPLQLPTGEWRNTLISNASFLGANSFVTVTPGSNLITLTGGTWQETTFYNGNFPGPVTNKMAYLWFFTGRNNTDLPGKQNNDLGGDITYYRVSSVTSPTTALLDRPYEGTAGNKGLIVSSLVGFGTQPFMMGLTAGAFGTYVYDALKWHGDMEEANLARQFTIDAVKWLASPVAFKSGANYNYGASSFLNCQVEPDSPGCAGDTVLNGEVVRAVAAAYRFTLDEEFLRFGDAVYSAVWCKPDGGWGCPAGGNGGYGNYLDDPPSGYMLNRNDPLSNKWFGFFFGYGFGAAWPAVRNLAAAANASSDNRAVSLQLDFNAYPNLEVIRVTMLYPDSSHDQQACTQSPCVLNIDSSKGNPIYRLDHYAAQNTLISSSEWSTLDVD